MLYALCVFEEFRSELSIQGKSTQRIPLFPAANGALTAECLGQSLHLLKPELSPLFLRRQTNMLWEKLWQLSRRLIAGRALVDPVSIRIRQPQTFSIPVQG